MGEAGGGVGFGMVTNNLTALLWRQEWRLEEDTNGWPNRLLPRAMLPCSLRSALGLSLVLFRWEATRAVRGRGNQTAMA